MGAVNNSGIFSAVSLSGGKDSSCLLLLMIEKGLPIDCVLYADTGMEFPEMEAHIAKLDAFLYQERGIHITIRQFDRIARKYGVDYAIKRDRSSNPPKFLVFFKSRDADALTSAFNEYVGKKVKKDSRPLVLQRLAHFKELVKNTVVNQEKRRELER